MKYFLAFYIAGWLFCLLRLYYPSIRFLQKFDSSNILVRQKVLGWLVASLGFFIATPLTLPVALSDSLSREFIVAFCDKALKDI